MKKLLFIIGGIIMTLFIVSGVYGYLLFSKPFQISKSESFFIDTDDNLDSIRVKVEQAGHPSSMTGFDIMAKLKKFGENIKPGCYEIKPSDNYYDMVRRTCNGIQTPIRLRVPETRTVESAVKTIARQLMLEEDEIMEILNDQDKLKEMGFTKETLPCLFIPDSYDIFWNVRPQKLVDRLKKEYDKFWNGARMAKAKVLGLSPNEVITLASIVESESAYNPEKARIAGLYINRLKKGMLLQSDPTVVYAWQDFSIRRILLRHLEINSPYNTYKHAGLPPGPIRIPSKFGIDSVLDYESHNYLYMCAKEDFSGSHNFAVTGAEHARNARAYQNALNLRGIKK